MSCKCQMYHELSDNADGVQVDIFGILSHNLSMTSLPFEFKTQLENTSLYIVILWFLNPVVPVLSQLGLCDLGKILNCDCFYFYRNLRLRFDLRF